MISLSTAKSVLRHARKQGIRIGRGPGWIFARTGAAGLAFPYLRAEICIQKGAPFELVCHEIGHALDYQAGNRLRRIWGNIRGRTYKSEIAANIQASDMLIHFGTIEDVMDFRSAMAMCQRRHRARRQGRDLLPPGVANIPTKYRLVKIQGQTRFMFIFDFPRRLQRISPGRFRRPDGFLMEIQISPNGNWQLGKPVDAAEPETCRPDGTYTYRSISPVIGGQYACLKITA